MKRFVHASCWKIGGFREETWMLVDSYLSEEVVDEIVKDWTEGYGTVSYEWSYKYPEKERIIEMIDNYSHDILVLSEQIKNLIAFL